MQDIARSAVGASRHARPDRQIALLLQTPSAHTITDVAALEAVGFEVVPAALGGPLEGLAISKPPRLCVVDLRERVPAACELVAGVSAALPETPIVLITSASSIATISDATRELIYECLVEPFTNRQLISVLRTALSDKIDLGLDQRQRNESDRYLPVGFIGRSRIMENAYRRIIAASRSKATTFITGESGTGKEICAQAIHRMSVRHNKPLIAVNCSAIPRDLIESELFGHLKGAFTGAVATRAGAVLQAHGGTLFLDEVCEMEAALQAKLLRFLETGTVQRVGAGAVEHVDVRVICATNRNPQAEVAAGRFREDLYYRLHVICIDMPPLRARGNDVIELAEAMLLEIAAEEGVRPIALAPCALVSLASYDWPGNVRQLRNVLRAAVVLGAMDRGECNELRAEHLPEMIRPANHPPRMPATAEGEPIDSIEPLWRTEQRAIEAAILRSGNSIHKAARALEISPSTVYRKRQAWAMAGMAQAERLAD